MTRHRLTAMARKEALHVARDPRSLVLAFVLPVLLLFIFGYAISFDVRDIRTAVLDQDHSARSRAFIDAFRASGYFSVERYLTRPREIRPLLDADRALMVLVIPPRFGADIDGGRSPAVQAIVDGSDANTATIALAYARAIALSYGLGVRLDGARVQAPLTLESRVWYNEALTSRNMIVPGLVAVIMMIVAAMLTSLTIAREWERGTMEQLAATPVTRAEVVLGKLLPYAVIGFIDVAVASLLGVAWFGVPFRGGVALFGMLSLLFLLGALGLGAMVSAITRSQLLSMQYAMVLTFLPAYLLSGFMFAIANMPQALQLLTYLIPARYFIVVTRGIFLKGVGLDVLYVQGLLMAAFATAGVLLAVAAFRKEIG